MQTYLLFINLGVTELLLILAVVILLFGSTQLPKLAKSIGLSLKEFKKAAKEVRDDIPEENDQKTESQKNSQPRELD